MQNHRNSFFVVQLFTHLLCQIGSLEAYRDSCNMSVATISVVSECPTNVSSYKEAVRKKNCSSLAADARHCTSFQYHCVLSEDLKNAVEVCAPSINIIDHVCAPFNTNYESIMRVHGLNCSACPWSYNSTLAFQYQECFTYLHQPKAVEAPLRCVKSMGCNWLWCQICVVPAALAQQPYRKTLKWCCLLNANVTCLCQVCQVLSILQWRFFFCGSYMCCCYWICVCHFDICCFGDPIHEDISYREWCKQLRTEGSRIICTQSYQNMTKSYTDAGMIAAFADIKFNNL